MERVKYIDHSGKKVLLFDFSNVKDCTEMYEVFDKAKAAVAKEKPKTVRMLTDVSNAHYNIDVVQEFKNWSKFNTPFALASAVIGASGVKKVFLDAVIKFTGREVKTFDGKDEALNWLASF